MTHLADGAVMASRCLGPCPVVAERTLTSVWVDEQNLACMNRLCEEKLLSTYFCP